MLYPMVGHNKAIKWMLRSTRLLAEITDHIPGKITSTMVFQCNFCSLDKNSDMGKAPHELNAFEFEAHFVGIA